MTHSMLQARCRASVMQQLQSTSTEQSTVELREHPGPSTESTEPATESTGSDRRSTPRPRFHPQPPANVPDRPGRPCGSAPSEAAAPAHEEQAKATPRAEDAEAQATLRAAMVGRKGAEVTRLQAALESLTRPKLDWSAPCVPPTKAEAHHEEKP